MKVVAPLHIGNLGKAFFTVLLLLTIAWVTASWLIFRDVYVVRPILIANLVLSVVLGWLYYRRRYHTRFSYNEDGFLLEQGRTQKAQHRWKDFSRLSLVHLGSGQMALRLYREKRAEEGEIAEEVLEIPASDLQLDAFLLREEISSYMGAEDVQRPQKKDLDVNVEAEQQKAASTQKP